MTEQQNHYETHITLTATDDVHLRSAQDWAALRELKWTHIVLDSGENPSQPMVTFWGTGTEQDQRARATHFVNELRQLNVEVARVKVETSVDNNEVPNSDLRHDPSPDCYFEHHIKLLLRSDSDLSQLRALAEAHHSRLSRNARRIRGDEHQERFVTQRLYGIDKEAAHERLHDLSTALRQNEFRILEVEEEYVVFDSNRELDRGWLNSKDGE